MEAVFAFNFEIALQLLLALALGMLVGAERTLAGKSAGMRTYGLVALGSALFIIVASVVTPLLVRTTSIDPFRIMAAIISGMGFLGVGLIIFHERNKELTGLTTAAGLWVAAGIGIAVGYKLYAVALTAVFLTLVAFTAMWQLEKGLRDVHLYEKPAPRKRTKRKRVSKSKKQK